MPNDFRTAPAAQVQTAEIQVYAYVRQRLPFLIAGDEELFQRLQHLKPAAYRTGFSLFYKQEGKGTLFNFWQDEVGYHFEFVALGPEHHLLTDNLAKVDASLLAAFKQRVWELG